MRFVVAAFVSLAFHALLAIAAEVWLLDTVVKEERSVELDLSRVDVSVSDEGQTSESGGGAKGAVPEQEHRIVVVPETRPPEFRPVQIPDRLPSVSCLTEIPHYEPLPEIVRDERADASSRAVVNAPPAPINAIRPVYPEIARRRSEEGSVVVAFDVDAEGRVSGARVGKSCGSAALDTAAVKAVREARFRPATSGGCPASASAQITITFRLRR